jgi:hypothetical protein
MASIAQAKREAPGGFCLEVVIKPSDLFIKYITAIF